MTSFKFNFTGPSENDPESNPEDIQWLECVKVKVTDQIENVDTIAKHAKMFMCGDVEIGHISIQELKISLQEMSENILDLTEKEHSDLITGKYEGGLKIWECTYDLVEYLDDIKINFETKLTLDLGCGSGILGIYAYQKGSKVTFQDYNEEVVKHVTIPNVLLNIEEENRPSEIEKSEFYSGDWQSFDNTLPKEQKFDIILSAETIYNINNYNKVINLFKNRLSKNGTVYIAAKTYYFGVGGGTRQFEQALKKSQDFESEIVWKTSSGIQREIMAIKWIQ